VQKLKTFMLLHNQYLMFSSDVLAATIIAISEHCFHVIGVSSGCSFYIQSAQ
jgi:hypothetical protein